MVRLYDHFPEHPVAAGWSWLWTARQAVVLLFQVSQAAAELQQYCMQNACKDALLVGVPAGSNPFREPRSCALLWRLVSNDTPWRYRRASQRIWATVLWISTILRGIKKKKRQQKAQLSLKGDSSIFTMPVGYISLGESQSSLALTHEMLISSQTWALSLSWLVVIPWT